VKQLGFLFTIILLIFIAPAESFAQNPKQSKKMKKKMKKKAKKMEPYTPNYHDRDSDGDGVPDGRDKCIHTPKGEPVTPFGCPYDADFDGVYDYEDQCKDQAGPRENHGCPWGDKDKDGIMDNVDDCPDVPGIAVFHGCPDTDGDGIKDSDDKCPKERGTVAYHGCPPPFVDKDGDGIGDYDDLCPSVKGVKSNKGCPEIKPEEKKVLEDAFKNLLFETNSDVIVETSFPSLKKLASLLINNPKYKLHLEGHTDNVGNDDANMDLSKRRAASVKRFLVEKGVQDYRITTDGFGETRPVDTNDTEEGRHRNRRVEMNIIYPDQH
jgi:outer membrane protein OmpA-like peptidoglycan-associated protein